MDGKLAPNSFFRSLESRLASKMSARSCFISYPVAQTSPQNVSGQKYAGYLLFILCASLYLLPFMRLLLQGTDEGLLVSGAVRVAHGQVFARDFSEVVGPGTFYWLALFFKLFGITFLATRVCLFLTSLATGLLMYFLSRRVCGRYQMLPCMVFAGTSCNMLWPTISHHVDSNVFALASVACAVIWVDRADRRKDGLLLAAGVLAGATTFFLQPKGVLLLLALLLWLSIERKRRLLSLVMVFGGYVSVVGIVLAYFWSRHALWDLIYVNILWPYQHYGAVNVVPYAHGIIQEYWASWAGPASGLRWRVGLAAVLMIPFMFVALLPALLLFLAFKRRESAAKPVTVLYWLCGWAFWLAEIHRKDIPHLVFGSPLLIVLSVHYLAEYRAKVADLMLQILAISAGCLVSLNFVLALSAHAMATRVGSVAVYKSDPVVAALDDRVAPGEEIFVYPGSPEYYFLSATTNPTRYSGLLYNYNSAAEFEEVVRVLDGHHIRYVLWDAGLEAKALKEEFPSAKPARPDQLIIEPYLKSHYETVWTDNKGVYLMKRNNEYQ